MDNSACSSEEADGSAAACGKSYVIDHLTHRKLNNKVCLGGLNGVGISLFREGPKGDRSYHTCLDALCSCGIDSGADDSCGSAVACYDNVSVLGEIVFNLGKLLLFDIVLLETLSVGLFKLFGLEVKGIDDVVMPLDLRKPSPLQAHCR